MTTPHDKAVLAADEAYQNVQASEGIEHLTSEQQHMRGVAAAISAYLASIGGVVCAREPVAWSWSFDGGTAWHFGPNKPGDFRFGNPDLVVPLHAPIPEAGNGDGWMDITSAPKNQKVLVAYQNELGNWRIVTACYHTQLEWSDEYGDHEQEYAPEDWYEENDSSEVIYPTARRPIYWRPLPPPPSIRSSDTGRAE